MNILQLFNTLGFIDCTISHFDDNSYYVIFWYNHIHFRIWFYTNTNKLVLQCIENDKVFDIDIFYNIDDVINCIKNYK